MQTRFSTLLGLEYPIAAFSHCRDVVAAVTRAGGLGVLGASTHSPAQLELDLRWLDETVGGRPYGIDFLFPAAYEGDDQEALKAHIPDGHRQFLQGMLDRYAVPSPKNLHEHSRTGDAQITLERALAQWDVAKDHPVAFVASALGVPPARVIEEARARGMLLGALVGSPKHVPAQLEAGVDVLVAQGYEAGGHTGTVTTMVLVPQVVDVAGDVPVLAAGGIADGRQVAAAMALGAAGVWTGSVWLTTAESDTPPLVKRKLLAATSSDTQLSRCSTGKPARQLSTDWVKAWAAPGAPEPLQAPLQGLLVRDALVAIEEHEVEPLMGSYVGQVTGMLTSERSSVEVLHEMIEQFVLACERLAGFLAGEQG